MIVVNDVRWGLLGTSTIARTEFARAVRAAAGSPIYAVASREAHRAEALARELGASHAYGSYGALLDDPMVTAVYVSLPNALHCEWTIKALTAGKHVLCEKPMAITARETRRMLAAAAAHRRVLVEGLMYRAHPRSIRARELVASGAIGNVQYVRTSYCYNLAGPRTVASSSSETNIRLDGTLGGGALLDVGTYCVDAINWYGSRVPSHAMGIASSAQAETRFTGVVGIDGQVVGDFFVAMDLAGASAVEILGTEGKLSIPFAFRAPAFHSAPTLYLYRASGVITEAFPVTNQYEAEVASFLEAVRGHAPLVSRDESLANAAVIDSLRASAVGGEGGTSAWVAVPS